MLATLVEVLIERDELTAAEAELDAAEMTSAVPDSWWFGPLLFSRARLHLARGRPQEALDDVVALGKNSAKAGVQAPYWPTGSYAALACSALGDQTQARQLAAEELEGARAWGLPRRLGIALRSVGLIEGGEDGLERLREALAVLERSPARLEYIRTLTDYGAMLRRTNRRAQARTPLRTALATARSAGALAIARRAHGELEATGEQLRPLLGIGVESLTPSERRIARMAAEGRTNREIAQELFLSLKTVETHLRHTYRKLDISSRAELPSTPAAE
jgi:DNA-binding CsgD family transcriptional regulator